MGGLESFRDEQNRQDPPLFGADCGPFESAFSYGWVRRPGVELVLEENAPGYTVQVLQSPGVAAGEAQAPQRLEKGG